MSVGAKYHFTEARLDCPLHGRWVYPTVGIRNSHLVDHVDCLAVKERLDVIQTRRQSALHHKTRRSALR